MDNDDWRDLASQWTGGAAADVDALQARVRRYRRQHRWSLGGELAGVALILLLAAWAWPSAPAQRPWLVAAGAFVVASQCTYLLMRRHFRLAALPGGGLLGLVDAELRRARYVIASMWVGLAGGMLMAPVAWATVPAEDHDRVLLGFGVATVIVVPWMVWRAWWMRCEIRRLEAERSALAG